MRDAYHLYLNGEEYSHIIEFLIEMKNRMLIEGKYTDGVDDVLCKFWVCILPPFVQISERTNPNFKSEPFTCPLKIEYTGR